MGWGVLHTPSCRLGAFSHLARVASRWGRYPIIRRRRGSLPGQLPRILFASALGARSGLEAVEAVERVKQSSHDWLPRVHTPDVAMPLCWSKRHTARFRRRCRLQATDSTGLCPTRRGGRHKSRSNLFSKRRQIVSARQTNLPLAETPAPEGRQTGFGEKKTDNGGRKTTVGPEPVAVFRLL
jgi:hypothetical protein